MACWYTAAPVGPTSAKYRQMAKGILRCLAGTKRAFKSRRLRHSWRHEIKGRNCCQTNKPKSRWLLPGSRAAPSCAPRWRWLSLHPVRERLEQHFSLIGGARYMRWGSSVTRRQPSLGSGVLTVPTLPQLTGGHSPARASGCTASVLHIDPHRCAHCKPHSVP